MTGAFSALVTNQSNGIRQLSLSYPAKDDRAESAVSLMFHTSNGKARLASVETVKRGHHGIRISIEVRKRMQRQWSNIVIIGLVAALAVTIAQAQPGVSGGAMLAANTGTAFTY